MSKLRSLNTAFWSDTWVEDLEPLKKLLFIYLVTNDKTNMLGIYEASIKKISFDYDSIQSSGYFGAGDDHWKVLDWDDGTTEPTSSGSALFERSLNGVFAPRIIS